MSDIVTRLRAMADRAVQAVEFWEQGGDQTSLCDAVDDLHALTEAADEIERLHTWGGLMSLLDEHWPEDLFPTLEDNQHRDPGVRIVSLIRWVDHLRGQ